MYLALQINDDAMTCDGQWNKMLEEATKSKPVQLGW